MHGNTKHGHAGRGNHSRLYGIWHSMHQRCTNIKASNYPNYGGRGITVCTRWNSFENFLQDMGEKSANFVLDRINNNDNYSPENCRWATYHESAQNTRNSRLTKEKVVLIKGLLCALNPNARKYYAYALIGKLFSVAATSIASIASGARWANVK